MMFLKKDNLIAALALLAALATASLGAIASALPDVAMTSRSTVVATATDNSSPTDRAITPDSQNNNVDVPSIGSSSWWLLPLVMLGGFLVWWFLRGQSEFDPDPSEGTDLIDSDEPIAMPSLTGDIALDGLDPNLGATEVTSAIPNLSSGATEAAMIPDELSALGNTAAESDPQTLAARAESIISSDRAARLSNHRPAETPDSPANEPLTAGSGDRGFDALAETGDVWDTDPEQPEVRGEAAPSIEAGSDMPLVDGMLETSSAQIGVEATKFDVGQTDDSYESLASSLASVDEGLPELPDGYGDRRIVLMPRDPQWGYAYWDITNEQKQELRQQGGSQLVLRLCDVTDIDLNVQRPHSLQQYDCDEMARDWYLPIPVSDRDYIAEIGYMTEAGGWLMLARSASARIPPTYPSDWFEEQFFTIDWNNDLPGKTFLELTPPRQQFTQAGDDNAINNEIFEITQSMEAQRVAGSLFGSMQQVPLSAISSFVSPSGVGMWAMPEVLNMSGMGMSGIGMSGAGFAASIPPIRPHKFWLVADAELIVYGATEPDAIVTIAGHPVKLNPDGTFRFQMSFQDGLMDYPILAIAADGEQMRSIHMEFNRETPERNTNTKSEAIDEWML
jgi:uncharacterized protein